MIRVRDAHGSVVWRVRVAPNELTCTGCGEVALRSQDVNGNPRAYCPHCGTDDNGNYVQDAPPLVATVAYLREGEYER